MSTFESEFPKTSKLLNESIPDVFPSCSVGIFENDKTHFYSLNCTEESLFDLASLTKVICTTSLCAILEEKSKLNIEDPIQSFYKTFPSNEVKISNLLDHTSGFPAWLDLHSAFHEAKGRGLFDALTTPKIARKRYEHEILLSWISSQLNTKVEYSDLGFMLLGWILEKKLSMPLDAAFQEFFSIPQKLKSLQFLPLSPNVVPTENCPWRGHILRGEVHDDNCYVLGGVAAHAGLFGNVVDVIRFGVLWLKAVQGQSTFITPQTAQKYWNTRHIPTSSRSLGWDGVSPEASSSGHFFSTQSTRGHLGYTGTSIWIDPEKNCIVTLLTNRVHPTRTNEKIKQFRPIFHDTLLEELGFNR